VRNGSRLKVANVVGGVVHELDMPDAALMSLLKALKLHFEEIESFHVTHERGLSGAMRRLEIGRRKRSAQAVRGDHLVHPIEPLEVVPVESARFRRPRGGEYAGLIPGKNGSVRYVRKAGDRQRSRPHRLCEVTAGRRCRGDPGGPAMGMDVDRDGVSQNLERACGRFGGLGAGR
jgi:hypothetical protein